MSNIENKNTNGPTSKKSGFLEENQKSLGFILVGIIVLILLYFGYQQFYLSPRADKAASEMFKAEEYAAVDSLRNKAIAGDGSFSGFEEIAKEYNNTKSANVANAYLGGLYLREGKYQEAINALEKYSETGSQILDPLVIGMIGDAYSEMNNYDKAIAQYKKAADKNKNSFTSPLMLKKLGLVYEVQNNNQAALESYKKIVSDFPNSQEANTVLALIARVEAKL